MFIATNISRDHEAQADAPPLAASCDGVVATPHRLDALPARLSLAWDELAQAAAEPNAFAERWFVEAGVAHLPGISDMRLLEVREQERLIGLFPLRVEPLESRLPLRIVANLGHHNSFLGTPLIRAGVETAAWGALLDTLDAARWAPGFLHLKGVVADGPVHRGLQAAASLRGRPCDIVQTTERALLASPLGAQAYYETTVRKKKRKELKRLRARLDELGAVTCRRLTDPADLEGWIAAFLALEAKGWKGEAGSALACDDATRGFFHDALTGAWAADRLEILRLDLDDAPIAMLVNFLTPPGAFSFKIAFDEDYARYSPGVLIQLENYEILDRPDIAWMDSCASADHPMINSLWAERRTIVRLSVPLAGLVRRTQFAVVRAAERAAAALRARRSHTPLLQQEDDQ
ncbi:GNAT family N-acetyltransferase [Stakelama tenebrarum]|uniref:GNAT family N-acetyltransferase n=1 Tax=Stakelama tenebrarum TaxID=2711215 RepID=A0A6G6Y8P0_9SPHN|nr:GNAT family N-acetyltransferase [Sphingosinithalassobacter tenebrarum]QIG81295.1 GNAT family N-acetyltransferase [Sphingosinithalassobacter tenebrarum]